jgi:O-methyltransferase
VQSIRKLSDFILRPLGYEIRRRAPVMDDRSAIDVLAAESGKDSACYKEWSSPCPVFLPWLRPEFERLFARIAGHTLLSRERCYFLASFAVHASRLQGDFAECGVYRGGTALLLALILKESGKSLYLFDSFKGLPKIHGEKDAWFSEGEFGEVRVEDVEELLSDFGKMIVIRPGWIPETFAGLQSRSYAFAHLDLDLYQSTLDSCEYFYPRLVPGGVLLFDEYGFAAARGEKEAVDEFFADKPESPIALPTGQAVVLKVAP